MLLFSREFVEMVSHGIELEARDFFVQMFGHHVNLGLGRFVIGA